MEKKNLIFALALSILVITVYQLFFMDKKPVVTPKQPVSQIENKIEDKPAAVATESTGSQSAFEQLKKPEPVVPVQTDQVEISDVAAQSEKTFTIETELYTAVFSNKGAALKSFILKNYLDDSEPDKHNLQLIPQEADKIGLYPFHLYNETNLELFRNINFALFESTASSTGSLIAGDSKRSITFKFSNSSQKIYVEKTYTFYGNSYVVDFDYKVMENNAPVKASFVFGPKLGDNLKLTGTTLLNNYEIGSFNGEDTNFDKLNKYVKNIPKQAFTPTPSEKFKFSPLQPIHFSRNTYWVSFNQNYFAALIKTDYAESATNIFFINEYLDKGKTNLYCYLTIEKPLSIYLGPKDATILEREGENHRIISPTEVINLGWFGFISKLLRAGVNFIYGFIPNYGWAIVLFTIFLKIILFPLTYSSGKSMAKMQTLQPKIKAIKKKYKNQKDPEQRRQMNVETMELYKQEKINPASGCFPLLLQMPILFGFFTLLRSTIEVRHEPWILWIKDLSLKDPLYILPIAMGVTQIIVQKLSPTSADSTQKKMAYIMPIFFVFICLNLPSGLTLYWFISNLLQIFQQKLTNNLIFQQKKDKEKELKALKRKKGRSK